MSKDPTNRDILGTNATKDTKDYSPMVDKCVDATSCKPDQKLSISKDTDGDARKITSQVANQMLTFVMALMMGVMTVLRMTRNIPRKLTSATLYSIGFIDDCIVSKKKKQLQASTISTAEYITLTNRLSELEEKFVLLDNKPAELPPDKEELLNNALKCIDALETELAATKKALNESLAQQQELVAYVEKQKKRRKKKFFVF